MTHWDRLEETGGIQGVNLSSQRQVNSKIQKNSRFFLLVRMRHWRRRRQAPQAPSAAGAKLRRRAAVWLTTGSSWPKRSEGHERSPAGVFICVRSPGGGRRPFSVYVCMCVCVYVCMCVCVYVCMCVCGYVGMWVCGYVVVGRESG